MRWFEQPQNIQAVLVCRWAGLSKHATAYRLRCSVASVERTIAQANKLGFSVPTDRGVSSDADTSLIWARIEKEVTALIAPPKYDTLKPAGAEVDLDAPPCAVALSLENKGLSKLEARRTAQQYAARAAEREAALRRIARSIML
jgi:hypothetical protein